MYKNKMVFAVILAAGKGTRMGFDKMLYTSDGKTVIYNSVNAFEKNTFIDHIIVVAGENIAEIQSQVLDFSKVINVIKGGETRSQSVANAMDYVEKNCLVAIHDGARPFVSQDVINKVIEDGFNYNAAIPCVPVKDTIKQSKDNFVENTPNRNFLYATQTPQVFDADIYKQILRQNKDMSVTDDAQLFEKAGYKVKISQGDYSNIKLTTPEDIKKEKSMRIGHGYDVHRLVEDRKLILGGVEIPFEKGLLGHSDADVLLHSISDSLLGALALGDIGKHFPDTDPKYKGADSLMLLEHVGGLIKEKGYKIGNIDATILCQRPKLAPYILTMRENVAKVLECSIDEVSIKATTEEKLGFTGTGEGISSHCVCILEKYS